MRKIYKYKLQHGTEIIHDSIVKFLTAQIQEDDICIWAEIDTELPKTDYCLAIVGTGWTIPENSHYINTVQYTDTMVVWHIYWSNK